MTILLATGNPHKAEELAAILGTIDGIELMTLRDLPQLPGEPEEDGETLEANAYIKALEIFRATGIPTVADDTGLEVDALDRAPGVRSARYAGESASYDENCALLLRSLDGVDDDARTARFRTVICYADSFRTLLAEGSLEGTIITEGRGSNGFGYDPLFLPEGSRRTLAEMSAEEKNAISHRARALSALHEILRPLLVESGEEG